jgi:hypothetical protein
MLPSLQSAISELQAPAWSCLAEPSLWPNTKRERVSFCCRGCYLATEFLYFWVSAHFQKHFIRIGEASFQRARGMKQPTFEPSQSPYACPYRNCYPARMPLKSATTASIRRTNPATECNNVTLPCGWRNNNSPATGEKIVCGASWCDPISANFLVTEFFNRLIY